VFEAEIKGKIPEIENMEDILTSTVFGLLKYISEKKVLLSIINQAKTISDEKFQDCCDIDLFKYTPEIIFWKNIPIYGEPDLIIKFKFPNKPELLLCIEVKYYSSKSGEGEDDQLGRYFEALDQTAFETDAQFLGIIYLTKYPATEELKDTLQYIEQKGFINFKRKIFHLSWFEITTTIKEFDKSILKERDKMIIDDLLEYLQYKNLVEFTTFSFLKKDFLIEPDTFYLIDKTKKEFSGFSFQRKDFNYQIHEKIIYG
jgi:hypothetical protein